MPLTQAEFQLMLLEDVAAEQSCCLFVSLTRKLFCLVPQLELLTEGRLLSHHLII